MFSNDHNVEIIARLISNLKRYGELRLKGLQLDAVSKLTLVLTLLVVTLVLTGVVSIVVLLLSFALVFALAPIVGSLVTACCLVAGGFVLLGVSLIFFRRTLLINPIARFLSSIFLGDDGEVDFQPEAPQANKSAPTTEYY